MAAPGNRDVFPLRSGWVSDEGSHVDLAWKATIYHDDKACTWELRLLLQDFYKGTGVKWTEKNFIKENVYLLNNQWEEFGISWRDVFVPNRQSQAMDLAGKDWPLAPYVRQEAQFLTDGVILWLLGFRYQRRFIADKAQAKALLCAFLASSLSLEIDWRSILGNFIDRSQTACQDGPIRPNCWCFHMDEDLKDFMDAREPMTWEKFADGLFNLYRSFDCGCAAVCLPEFVRHLAKVIDAEIAQAGFGFDDFAQLAELFDRGSKNVSYGCKQMSVY